MLRHYFKAGLLDAAVAATQSADPTTRALACKACAMAAADVGEPLAALLGEHEGAEMLMNLLLYDEVNVVREEAAAALLKVLPRSRDATLLLGRDAQPALIG